MAPVNNSGAISFQLHNPVQNERFYDKTYCYA